MSKYVTYISDERRWFDLNLKEVWQYRDLILLFTKRSFVVTYKQTVLGPAWIFLNPFLTSIMFTVVFGNIAGMSTDGVPQLLFYLCSNAIWIFFSTCVTKNATTFTANANVFGKVYFPRLTIPVSNALSAVVQFAVQMLLVVAFLLWHVITKQVQPNWAAWLLIPVVLVHLGMLGLGCGIIISSLTTKYRDLAILVTFGVQLWMYATPILFPVEILPVWLQGIVRFNPLTHYVSYFRQILLYGEFPSLEANLICILFAVLFLLLGITVFRKNQDKFILHM